MKRWIAIILLLSVLLLGGCQREDRVPDVDLVERNGALRVGVTECPPFAVFDGGQWTGFDVELTGKIAQILGVRAEYVPLSWQDRWMALNDGTVDCVVGCVTATDDLATRVDLSQTYLASAPVLVTTAEYEGEMEFVGITVAVETDSACAMAVAACIPQASVVDAAHQTEALELVTAGEAQSAVVDRIVASNIMSGDLLIHTGLDLGVHELAVATRLNSDLTEAINKALMTLQTQGELNRLAELYQIGDCLVVG